MKPTSLAIVVLSAIMLLVAPLHAQQPVNAAQQAFEEGLALMKDGQYAAACEKLEVSQRIEAGMGTQFRLAECYEKQGRLASAWKNFRAVAAQARAEGMPDREGFALKWADALEPRLSKLAIQVPAEVAALPGLAVTHNGAAVASADWGGFAIDKGSHRLVATATGKLDWSVELDINNEGQTFTVKVPMLQDEKSAAAAPVVPATPESPAPAPPASPAATPASAPEATNASKQAAPPPPDAADDTGSGLLIGGLAVAGVGVAGIAAGIGIGAAAKGEYDESETHCVDNMCTQEGLDIRDSARATGTIGTVVFAVGCAAVVGGGLMWLLAPSNDDASGEEAEATLRYHIAPTAGGAYAGVSGHFDWIGGSR